MGRACNTNGGDEECTKGGVDNIKMDLREIGWDGMVRTGSLWIRIETSGRLF
jgi:hypothetical protein